MGREINRIGVAGGAGFVGSMLCRLLLDRQYEVRVMDNLWKTTDAQGLFELSGNSGFEFIKGDCCKDSDVDKFLDGIDAIIALPSVVGAPLANKYPYLSKLFTVDAIANLVTRKKDDVPLVFASTGSVLGKIDEICTEETKPNPQSLYGVHKLEAEQYVLNEKNTITYRYSTAFGMSPSPRLSLLVNDFCWKAYYERYITVFEAEARRSFISCRDMGRSLVFAIENHQKLSSHPFPLYNVGSNNNNYTKREILEMISKKIKFTYNCAEFMKDPDARDYHIDFSKINNMGFYAFEKVEDGIDELVRAMPMFQRKEMYV